MATEDELAEVRPRLLGLIPEERIATVTVTRPPREVVDAFLALGDLSSTVSDVLDDLGIGGQIAASDLKPLQPGQRICGPAITIRYSPEAGNVGALMARGEKAKLADRDMYGVGQAGDVAVFDCGGRLDGSVMGGLSARWARRTGMAGCLVDGAIRDIAGIRELGVPVWSRGVTPRSGKHRMEAVEINGPVTLAGALVHPGDLMVADDTGACVIPAAQIDEVLRRCRETEEAERALIEAIDSGRSTEEIVRILRPERW